MPQAQPSAPRAEGGRAQAWASPDTPWGSPGVALHWQKQEPGDRRSGGWTLPLTSMQLRKVLSVWVSVSSDLSGDHVWPSEIKHTINFGCFSFLSLFSKEWLSWCDLTADIFSNCPSTSGWHLDLPLPPSLLCQAGRWWGGACLVLCALSSSEGLFLFQAEVAIALPRKKFWVAQVDFLELKQKCKAFKILAKKCQ